MSLTDKTLGNAVGTKVNFVGLKNYEGLVHNSAYLASVRLTNVVCDSQRALLCWRRTRYPRSWSIRDFEDAVVFVHY